MNLGILAGGGPFPRAVAQSARASGREVFIVAFEGHADPDTVFGFPHAWVRLGAVGPMLDALKTNRCAELVIIGRVRRPSLREIRPDARGLRLLPRLAPAFSGGDDTLLAAIAGMFEAEGIRVVGAHSILAEALAAAGLLTRTAPDAIALEDIARGRAVATALGAADVGQACVVQGGIVLAVEAIEGTDAMLARAAAVAREGLGGVLVKLVKPGQDRRVDLPTIGPDTVARAAEAGLRGIAVSTGETLLVDKPRLLSAADAAGMFVLGLEREKMAQFLHTMIRVGDLDRSLDFYTRLLGMREQRRTNVPEGKYTLVFVGYGDKPTDPMIELTYNYGQTAYDQGTAFGHLAVGVPDVAATCARVREGGGKVTREPGPVKFGTTVIAFVEDPDGYKIELIERPD